MKILYIPAENFSANVARSYFVSKGFGKDNKVFIIHWYDNRNRFWEGKSPSKLYTAFCFIKSLLSRFSIEKIDENRSKIYCSVFLNAFIGKVIGRKNSLQLMRYYNKTTLEKVSQFIKPDIIYHADGFYYFPALNKSIPEFSDLQDDINWKSYPKKIIDYEIKYYSKQFNSTKLNFIVSKNAASSFNNNVKCSFEPFDNGADFKGLRSFSSESIYEFKKKHNIPTDKIIISYIGGAHKFDADFTKKLSEKCLKFNPNIHFILVGNLPKVEMKNISNIGFLNVDSANMIYSLSDIGITLKNTENDPFLYNSVPLKFIQYSAVRKPIITFPIKWAEEKKIKNIFNVYGENTDEWIRVIQLILSDFHWDEQLSTFWEQYDWQSIADNVLMKIKSKLISL